MKRILIIGSMGVGVSTSIARTLLSAGHEVIVVNTIKEAKQEDPFHRGKLMVIKELPSFDDIFIPKDIVINHPNPATRTYKARRRQY